MLDQVIHTRSLRHRDLKKRGAVNTSDGLGVFSMSETIFANVTPRELDMLDRRAAVCNGSEEEEAIGLLQTYEYFFLPDGSSALMYDVARPKSNAQRTSGISHRAGTHIKQVLVGDLQGYPCEYFGADCWTAHRKDENYYYLNDDDTAEPAWLPQVPSTARNGSVTRASVRAFVQAGRTEAVKQAVRFVIDTFSRPVDERKVLVIKDTPANVELWVAAIGYAFSADMARQISFTTNRTKLNTNTNRELFYATDDAGHINLNPVGKQTGWKRTPYCMIVGVHPQDRKCSTLRALLNSDFVMLDGATGVITPTLPLDTTAPYFNAVVQYGEDIEDFCTVLLPSLPLNGISLKLPALYDAYRYLLCSDHKADRWMYNDTLTHLEALLSIGMPNNAALSRYLLEECLRAWEHLAAEDATHRYRLLKVMWHLSGILKCRKDVTRCAADPLVAPLYQMETNGTALTRYWSTVRPGDILDILADALREIFADDELPVHAKKLGQSSADTVATVLDMYLTTLAMNGGIDTLTREKVRCNFVCEAFTRVMNSRPAAVAALRSLSVCPGLEYEVAAAVAVLLEQRGGKQTMQWMEIIMEATACDCIQLCKKLRKYNTLPIHVIEQLLGRHIRATGRCDYEYWDTFNNAVTNLRAEPDTGRVFFEAWMSVMTSADYSTVIDNAMKMNLSDTVTEDIFHEMDRRMLPGLLERRIDRHIAALQRWSNALAMDAQTLDYRKLEQKLQEAQQPQEVIGALRAFGKKHYRMNDVLLKSGYLQMLAASASDLSNAELMLELLLAFDCGSTRSMLQDYVNCCVRTVLDTYSKSARRVQQMILLAKTARLDVKQLDSLGWGDRYKEAGNVQDALIIALRKQLYPYVRSGDTERITKALCSEQVKNDLLAWIEEGKSKADSPLGRIIGFFRGGH